MRCSLILIAISSVVLLSGCPSGDSNGVGQVEKLGQSETFVHEPSGFQFPGIVSGVARLEIRHNDREGRDISVDYQFLQNALMTISIAPVSDEPSDNTLQGHLDKFADHLAAEHKGTKKISEESDRPGVSGKNRDARRAAFNYQGPYFRRHERLRSDVYVLSTGKWFVTYVITYPQSEREAGERIGRDFLEAFTWPKEAEAKKGE
jgi:hypothetical protein